MDKTMKPSIGKNVIETLTTGMYEDYRFIYREYIQNSADQIDKAIQEGLIRKEDGAIHILIDNEKRTIVIEDNATGIQSNQVLHRLRDIAESIKKRGVDKGFRGIGRLGGLGYSKKLIFETSFKCEPVKSIMTWDAKLLKEIIDNEKVKEHASEVIDRVTDLKIEREESEKHYFKVILENVTEPKLLDRKNIEAYLSMTAPVPYSTAFSLKTKIYEELKKENLPIDEYNIFINGDQIFKAYTKTIYREVKGKKQPVGEIFDIQFLKEYTSEGNLLFWGWYGLSKFEKQLARINIARGIRLRKDNIQIGSDYTLVKFFREQRGNYYFFGEVHAFNRDLIPNARRDYFKDNETCQLFEKKLRENFHRELHKLYYDASKIKIADRDVQKLVEFEKEKKEKEEKGFTDKEDKEKFLEKGKEIKQKAIEAKKTLERVEESLDSTSPTAKIFKRIVKTKDVAPEIIKIDEEDQKPPYRTDKLSKLGRKERKFLSKIFAIIRKNLSPDLAEKVIEKIEEELK
jgi:molecular chaperone HtpG